MSDAPIIEAWNVSKWFGEVLGLSDVTLAVGPGITGLLGPNGAGKSTLLHVLTGQLQPNRGRVWVLGGRAWNNPRLNARTGFCPEQDNFPEHMSGHGWLTFLARLAGFRGADAGRRADQLLAVVELSDAAGKRIGQYSKGMRQRIKLAQALLHDPELLFLDEPLQGTDPLVRRALVALIRRLVDEGRHVLVSSHILHEVELLTRRIVLIHQGRVRAEGDLEEIRRLLTHVPHRVRIECPAARALGARLWALPYVGELELLGEDRLIARTDDPARFYREFPALIAREHFPVRRFFSPDDSLDAVFRHLTARKSHTAAE